MKKKITISAALLFVTIISFAQSATLSVAQDYSYADNSAPRNTSVLNRLKMSDADNSVSYSAAVKAEKVNTSKSEIVIFPDLAQQNQKITISNLAEPSNISICDYTGRLIQKLSSTGNSVQINNLQQGTYFVNIIGLKTGTSSVKKLSVIK